MPYRTYLRAVNERFGFLGTWLPGQHLSLGDIGTLDKGMFKRQDSLARFGYELEEEASDVPVDLDHSSGTTIGFSMGGEANASGLGSAGLGSAEARIQFGSAGAFVLRAVGCIEHALASSSALKRALRELHAKGIWEDDWVVIDRLFVADALTVLVCTSTSGAVKIAAKTNAQAGPFDIADAALELTTSAWEGDVTRVVGARSIVPMYSASRLRTGFFSSDRLGPAKLTLRGSEFDEVMPVTLQDALNKS
jgi:hypothetical protein